MSKRLAPLEFSQDIKTRPEESTLEDYERIPVSDFGAALMRGMGWKEGMSVGRNGSGYLKLTQSC